jgi:hypothetical protein
VVQRILIPDPAEFEKEIEVLQRVASANTRGIEVETGPDGARIAREVILPNVQMEHYRALYDDYFADTPRSAWPEIARQLIPIWQTLIYNMQTGITPDIKERILNWLLYVPREERLSPRTLAILQLPTYGGIHEISVIIMLRLGKTHETEA